MELKEAKKALKKTVKELEECIKMSEKYNITNTQAYYDMKKEKEAIEIVLVELQRLQEDNEELDRENQLLFEIGTELHSIKNKIEDKIEELREGNEVITQEEYYARNYVKKFLQDLLEG